MGSSSSKAAKTAASAARRQYPSRVPPPPTTNRSSAVSPPAGQPTAPGPTIYPQTQASSTRDETISLDASDPDFAASLRSLGPVQPSSTLSNSSTFNPNHPPSSKTSPTTPHPAIFPDASQNPALAVLTARDRLVSEAEAEFARARRDDGAGVGRRFLDVGMIRQILVMRDELGMAGEEIERSLGLGRGVLRSLGCVGDVKVGERDAGDSGIY